MRIKNVEVQPYTIKGCLAAIAAALGLLAENVGSVAAALEALGRDNERSEG